ncbi:Clavaminate synthase-like protein [Emericellopsis cladophorae]|uniref:Trimethyllysine dioxygenase n=1 Tax=Emericellopsis cladophorae TaxID=2686198 RepID=A0A9Q0BIT1_9HYPO|nr:Clavaminate synthase-like protein [Emericellopsis cladophorae]KAI6786019.1 Clavaminate synthase-like protein [Emericellopsis cladophorae]
MYSSRDASKVSIPIDGHTVDFSAVLLRDSCQCPRCVHESTNQRLFSVADIPSNIKPRTVQVDAASDSVNITWQNDAAGYMADHTTKLALDALRNFKSSGAPSGSRRESFIPHALWSLEPLNLQDYDYNTYMVDDEALYALMKQLRTSGLAFVKNSPGLEATLATIATRIGPIKDTFYGYTWDVRTVPAAINAAYTSGDLGFHTDLLYFAQPPHIQLLHCIQSASTGGASVFADAYKAAVDLFHEDIDAFETLTTVPVNYHYNHPNSNVYRTTKPVIGLRPLRIGHSTYTDLRTYIRDRKALGAAGGGPESTQDILVDCLDKINWGPPFLAPFSLHEHAMEQDDNIGQDALPVLNSKVERWHGAAQKFNALLQRPEYLYERKMGPGDCVLFDNTRTLHSRRAFDGADIGKPRWLRGTYVDKDPFYSKLRVLRNKFGDA